MRREYCTSPITWVAAWSSTLGIWRPLVARKTVRFIWCSDLGAQAAIGWSGSGGQRVSQTDQRQHRPGAHPRFMSAARIQRLHPPLRGVAQMGSLATRSARCALRRYRSRFCIGLPAIHFRSLQAVIVGGPPTRIAIDVSLSGPITWSWISVIGGACSHHTLQMRTE